MSFWSKLYPPMRDYQGEFPWYLKFICVSFLTALYAALAFVAWFIPAGIYDATNREYFWPNSTPLSEIMLYQTPSVEQQRAGYLEYLRSEISRVEKAK